MPRRRPNVTFKNKVEEVKDKFDEVKRIDGATVRVNEFETGRVRI